MRVGIVMPLAEQRRGAQLALLHLFANAVRPQQAYSVAFFEAGSMVEEVAPLGYDTAVLPAGRLRQARRFVATVRKVGHWMWRERLGAVWSWMAKAHLSAGPTPQLAQCVVGAVRRVAHR